MWKSGNNIDGEKHLYNFNAVSPINLRKSLHIFHGEFINKPSFQLLTNKNKQMQNKSAINTG